MTIRNKFKNDFKGTVDAAYDPATGKIKVDRIGEDGSSIDPYSGPVIDI